MNNIIIAIDGYAATGKSTQAKKIATHLGYKYIDTGAMYRAVTLYAIQNNISFKNIEKFKSIFSNLRIEFIFENNKQKTFLNGKNVEKLIRSSEVSEKVSSYSEIKEIRDYLIKNQRFIGRDKRIVMDGRDIGTVVFPNAECKFFFTAEVEIRARRRFNEMKNSGLSTTYKKVLKNLIERDKKDSSRSFSPLKIDNDAILIDVTQKNIDEIYTDLLKVIKKHI